MPNADALYVHVIPPNRPEDSEITPQTAPAQAKNLRISSVLDQSGSIAAKHFSLITGFDLKTLTQPFARLNRAGSPAGVKMAVAEGFETSTLTWPTA